MAEEWKVYIETYNTRCGHRIYEVSNFGRVKVNGIITEPHITSNGYKGIGSFSVHRAVAELFIPNPDNKPCVDHIDTNKLNNMAQNLRWVTYKENNSNPLTRQHRSKTMKNMWRDQEYRQKVIDATKIALNKLKTKQKISEISKKNWSNSEFRQKTIESMKGKPKSNEHKKKLSEANKGKNKDRIWVNKNNDTKFIKKDQLDLFLNKGWKLGRK